MAPQVLYRVCYGSPNPSVLQRSLFTIRPSVLHSHCRHKIRGCDYPCIVPAPDASVRGTLVQGLTEGDIWRLDIFEGDQYTRERVRVRVLEKIGDEQGKGNVEGEEVEAETYVWADDQQDLEEGEWDFAEFQREKIQRWIGNNEEYEGGLRPSVQALAPEACFLVQATDHCSEVDDAVRAGGKDPTGGRGANRKITEPLDSKKVDALDSAV